MKINTIFKILVVFLIGTIAVQAGNSFKMPEYEKYQMKNGMTVYLLEQHEVPLIYARAVISAGAVNDNSKYGLASMTGDGLMLGTKTYSREQIEELVDFLGAELESSTGREATDLKISFAKKDTDRLMPVFAEIIKSPLFPQAEFEKMKNIKMAELEQAKESPNQVIYSYYHKFIYGDGVYGNPSGGTRETVAELQIADLQKFYNYFYLPQNTALIMAGDFNSDQMKNTLEKYFGKWNVENSGEAVKLNYGQPDYSKSRILLVDKQDSRQTTFIIGGKGISRNNPDYTALQVINTVLGGRFTSWLNDELRVNAGLTYGARSRFSTYQNGGLFTMFSFTGIATTVEAVDLAVEVYGRLFSRGIDEETLLSAKNYVKGQFPPRYETAGELAELLADMHVYGFDESFINDFQKNVDSLDVEKAKKLIDKYFPKNNLQFVLIGKAGDIRDGVKKYGELSEKNIEDSGF